MASLTRLLLPLVVFVVFLGGSSGTASAQDRPVRFGAGSHVLVSTVDGLGLGVMGRVSIPLNADVSLAIGSGLTGFVLGGTLDAEWIITPHVAVIVTLPGIDRAPYVGVGVGGYVPLADPGRERAGPTFNVAVGRVRLLSQTSLFYEVQPMLILQDRRIDVALPVRVGIIF